MREGDTLFTLLCDYKRERSDVMNFIDRVCVSVELTALSFYNIYDTQANDSFLLLSRGRLLAVRLSAYLFFY